MDVPVVVERSDAVPVTVLARVRQGDHAAFTELVVAHDADMVRLCMVICRDPDLARDATQDAWHRLWSRPPTLRDEAKLRSWLLSVAANEARQQLRRHRVDAVRELRAPQDQGTTDPAGDIERLDLDDALARLDPPERELLGAPLRAEHDLRRDRRASAPVTRGRPLPTPTPADTDAKGPRPWMSR